jgi:hypothetical protein
VVVDVAVLGGTSVAALVVGSAVVDTNTVDTKQRPRNAKRERSCRGGGFR